MILEGYHKENGVKKSCLRRFQGLFYASFTVIIVGYHGPTRDDRDENWQFGSVILNMD